MGEPGHVRLLTLWPLVTLIFFEVSGGPFGTEVRTRYSRRALNASLQTVCRAAGDICDGKQPALQNTTRGGQTTALMGACGGACGRLPQAQHAVR